MRRQSPTLWIVLGVIIIFLFWGCNQYNSLVPARNEVDNKWAQVQNMYQRRADLIDNLVNTVKAQVKAENKTLTDVISARNIARSNFNSASKISGDSLTQQNLDKFQNSVADYQKQNQIFVNVVSEQYPDLKSATAFTELRTEMAGTENRVATARMDFNNSVRDFDNRVQRFPINLFAGIFNMKARGFFAAEPGSEKAPKVDNDFMK